MFGTSTATASAVSAVRAVAATDMKLAGESVNKLRMDALEANMPFVAGILRAAEESILCAYNQISDVAVKDNEL